LVRGLGLRSANTLIKHFKQPEGVFDSTRGELEALGVPPEVGDDALSPRSQERAAEAEVEAAARASFLGPPQARGEPAARARVDARC